MSEKTLPNYQELHQALSKTAAKIHPSQVHGLACGILSGNTKDSAAWEEWAAVGEGVLKTEKVLQALFEGSAQQLNEFLFEFQLVLPSDSDDLSLRAEALTLWCQGFLTGLKLAQVQIAGRPPGETTEAISDLIEIAKMNYEDVVANEEDENAYVELVEYVRMAAILIYQELREQKTPHPIAHSTDNLH